MGGIAVNQLNVIESRLVKRKRGLWEFSAVIWAHRLKLRVWLPVKGLPGYLSRQRMARMYRIALNALRRVVIDGMAIPGGWRICKA